MFRRFLPYTVATALAVRWTATDAYVNRHIGPTTAEAEAMLKTVNNGNLMDLPANILPKDVLRPKLNEFPALSENDTLQALLEIGKKIKL